MILYIIVSVQERDNWHMAASVQERNKWHMVVSVQERKNRHMAGPVQECDNWHVVIFLNCFRHCMVKISMGLFNNDKKGSSGLNAQKGYRSIHI